MSTTRDEFVSDCNFGFLVSEATLYRPGVPRRTMSMPAIDIDDIEPTHVGPQFAEMEADAEQKVLAVRKVQDTLPHMITVGRTANNDVVVSDVSVSKFHACFSLRDGKVMLSDGASRNGTILNGQLLEARGEPVEVPSGASVVIGRAKFR